jgi:hypothetical protein
MLDVVPLEDPMNGLILYESDGQSISLTVKALAAALAELDMGSLWLIIL